MIIDALLKKYQILKSSHRYETYFCCKTYRNSTEIEVNHKFKTGSLYRNNLLFICNLDNGYQIKMMEYKMCIRIFLHDKATYGSASVVTVILMK